MVVSEDYSEQKDTIEKYSLLWSKYYNNKPSEQYHFDCMQEVIPDKIIRGSVGIDIGCGCGWDVFNMARINPSVKLIGMDISDGVYVASKINKNIKNTSIIKGSADHIPLKNEVCDFVYSFGVLHHMPDYKKGLSEITRILKKTSPCFLYLYEDHSENFIKYIFIKIISIIRKATVKISPQVIYILSVLLSPVMVVLFSYPARVFKKFNFTYRLYENMPFNFGGSLFSLSGDLYDRFSTPIEHRFRPETLYKLFQEFGYYNVNIAKLKATAGWVVWGYKNR